MIETDVDRKVDRRVFFDLKSKNPEYRARNLVGPTARFRRIWKPRHVPLNQGSDGSCVGFACATLLAATPIRHIVSNASAYSLYRRAVAVDEREGRNFEYGASILGGMKACKELGLFSKYVWNFGIDDTIDWIIRRGPVILGINWYDKFDNTNSNGLMTYDPIEVPVGGHAIVANGYWPAHPDFGDVVIVTNSFGLDWGYRGRGFVPINTLDALLQAQGESVAPTELPPRRIVDE